MKQALHIVGALLCVAAIIFFIAEVRNAGITLPPGGVEAAALPLLAASVACGSGVVLLSVMWSILLLGRTDRQVVASYLVAQFGKYIPGNVFQFVGRHMLGRELGIAHTDLARAAIYEIVFLIATAGVVAGMFVARAPENLEWLRPVAAAGGVVMLLAILLAPRLAGGRMLIIPLPLRRWAVLGFGYLVFFTIFGAMYWVCLWVFGMSPAPRDPVGAASLGWILGFVVPGAPAGAGLREAAMSLVPVGEGGKTAAVLGAIVAFRVVTMCGDLLALLLGLLMRHRHRHLRDALFCSEKAAHEQSHSDRKNLLTESP